MDLALFSILNHGNNVNLALGTILHSSCKKMLKQKTKMRVLIRLGRIIDVETDTEFISLFFLAIKVIKSSFAIIV